MPEIAENSIKYNAEDLVEHYGLAALIRNDKGEILMQKHNKYGFWTIPVGKASMNESVTGGMKKEVFEETNLRVEECHEIWSKTNEYIRNGIKVKVHVHAFEIDRYSGTLENKESHKHSEQRFMSVAKIMKLSYISNDTKDTLRMLGFDRAAQI